MGEILYQYQHSSKQFQVNEGPVERKPCITLYDTYIISKMDIKDVGVSEKSEEHVPGNQKEGSPYYIVAESLTEFCPAVT